MKRLLYSLGVLLCSFGLWAQSDANKGQILGTIFDKNQAVVPNAKITIRNPQTGVVRELRSNGEGQFRAVLLDPGTYEVTVESPGLATSVLKEVVVNVGSACPLRKP
jgi:carboxypeptidase family protein